MGGKQHRCDATIWKRVVLTSTIKCLYCRCSTVIWRYPVTMCISLLSINLSLARKKTLTLLKSFRFSHRDLSISELLFLFCSHLWAIAHCLVFATRWRYLGIVSVGLCYHWTSLSSSGKNKEPTRLALFALCVLKMKSMYQATTKFSCSCIPLRWWLPVSPSTFSFIGSKSVLYSS